MNLCHNLANTLTISIMILASLILSLEEAIHFILAFRMVQLGHTMLN